MKQKGLLLKTNLNILSVVALTLLLTFAIISIRTASEAKENAKEMAGLKARKIASDLRNYLNQTMEMNKTLALSTQVLHQDKVITREMLGAILKELLDKNNQAYATWTMWEPNAFDGKDAFYAQKHHQLYGRFSCSYYRNMDSITNQNFGTIEHPAFYSSDLLEEYEEDYYRLAVQYKKDIIIPPYYYSFTNDSNNIRFMTSMVSPIFRKDTVIGVIGTDVNLEELQSIVKKSSLYKTGFVGIIASNFKMVAHSTDKYIESPLNEIFGSIHDSITIAIKNGQPYSYQTTSEVHHDKVYRYFYPVLISETITPWAIIIEIPSDEIFAEVRNLSLLVIFIGAIGFLIIALMIYHIIKNITEPISQVVQLAKNISLGRMKEPFNMKEPTNEIGELHQSLELMIEKLKIIQQVILLGTWEMNSESLQMNWSDRLFILLGLTQQKEPNLNLFLQHIHPEDKQEIKQILAAKDSTDNFQLDHRFRIIHSDGSIRNMLMRFVEISDSNGKVKRRIGVILDITTITQNEEKLKESETKFRNIFECSNDSILIIDINGNFIDANQMAFKRSGMSRKKLLSLNYKELIMEDLEERDLKYKSILFNGKDERFETKYVNAEGKTIHLEVNGRAMKYKGKDSFVLISRDVTDRKEADKHIIQTIVQTEEEERGRFARELHDGISPILSAIKLYTNALEDTSTDNLRKKITQKIISAVDEAIQGIYEISNNLTPHVLQNFGFKSALQTFIQRIEENTAINFEVQFNLTSKLDKNIEVTLYRIFTELINNTIKYSGANQVIISLTEDSNVYLHYSDNGCGFNMEDVKLNKRSTGMFNLTNRVHSFDGQISIASSPGHGVKVDVKIPIHDQ